MDQDEMETIGRRALATFLSGLVAVGAVALTIWVTVWMYNVIDSAFASIIGHTVGMPNVWWMRAIYNITAFSATIATIMLIGLFLQTQIGNGVHLRLNKLLERYPIYKFISEWLRTLAETVGKKGLMGPDLIMVRTEKAVDGYAYGALVPDSIDTYKAADRGSVLVQVFVFDGPIANTGDPLLVPVSSIYEPRERIATTEFIRSNLSFCAGLLERVSDLHQPWREREKAREMEFT